MVPHSNIVTPHINTYKTKHRLHKKQQQQPLRQQNPMQPPQQPTTTTTHEGELVKQLDAHNMQASLQLLQQIDEILRQVCLCVCVRTCFGYVCILFINCVNFIPVLSLISVFVLFVCIFYIKNLF